MIVASLLTLGGANVAVNDAISVQPVQAPCNCEGDVLPCALLSTAAWFHILLTARRRCMHLGALLQGLQSYWASIGQAWGAQASSQSSDMVLSNMPCLDTWQSEQKRTVCTTAARRILTLPGRSAGYRAQTGCWRYRSNRLDLRTNIGDIYTPGHIIGPTAQLGSCTATSASVQ